jgi:hypothetical protein
LKELLADCDVLDGHEPTAWLVFLNRVDQDGWIAICDAAEDRGKIEGHLS